jgi:hypothetical protein
MPIPFSSEFLYGAGVNIPGSMQGILDAIIGYHKAVGKNRVDELYILHKEIDRWQKDHKSGYFTNRKRESAVWTLRTDVLNELDAEEPGLGTALMNFASPQARRTGCRIQKRANHVSGGREKAGPLFRIAGTRTQRREGPVRDAD